MTGNESKSIANVARFNVDEFLYIAAEIPIKPEVDDYALSAANRAFLDLTEKPVREAKVASIA